MPQDNSGHEWEVNLRLADHPFLTFWKCQHCGAQTSTHDNTEQQPCSWMTCRVSPPARAELDSDLYNMSFVGLMNEVTKLRNGIRKHRDAQGHNLCWWVPELWNLLPEKITPDPRPPERGEFLRCCGQYRDSLEDLHQSQTPPPAEPPR